MSHCTLEATLKPKRFEFTLKTVIGLTDVFLAQVYWEAVPKTWPGGSKWPWKVKVATQKQKTVQY